MRPLRIPLRVVFYRESGRWHAHCLEFDLIGDGRTKEAALRILSKAIGIQLKATIKHQNPANLFTPADGKYFEMFAAGNDVAVGAIEFKRVDDDPIVIDDVSTREYRGAELSWT